MVTSGGVRAAWLLLVVTLLSGLIAMHGLADGSLSAATSQVGSGAAITTHMGTHTTESVRSSRAGGGAPVTAAALGCGMDHAGCVAVLRADHHLALPAAISAAVTLIGLSLTSWRVGPAKGSRGPPEVSLTRLGISRT